jgi:CubicO group peptidase (beta-lactamase class C family)
VSRRIVSRSSLAVFLIAHSLTLPVALAGEPTLEQRVQRVSEQLEAGRVQHHIPGMAIAIVKDDAVILARGFGEANIAEHVPATEQTRFAIGSTTKAFTATLIGMLVDEGKMSWDDPVRKFLPDYRLSDAAANEQVVIRDLLCHRIGLANMDMLWYATKLSREEILAASYKAEMLFPFREKWNYHNVSFLAAGQAIAAATGKSWDETLAERILTPLGMKTANSTYAAAQADALMARGYLWNEDKKELTEQPMRNIDAIGPAGSINASVLDMAQWIRFQLGRGELEGERLLSAEQHAETWKPIIDTGMGGEYALGWMVADMNGRRVITHDGGIDGFTAHLVLLPEESLGFVLLMNLFAAPLAASSNAIVIDGLLGEWKDEAESSQPEGPAEDFSAYVGAYLGNFGPFDGREFEVLVQNGRLAVDVPGQIIYELHGPDESGKRPFTLTDTISVRFNRDSAGAVYSMSMYQAGMAFEFPRKGASYPVEIDLNDAGRYLGRYRSEPDKQEVEVLIQNNRLAIDVPGQMKFELFPPDAERHMAFRIAEESEKPTWVRFNAGEDGTVESMFLHQGDHEETLQRVKDSATALPSREELAESVHQALGGKAIESLRNYREVGSIKMVHMGFDGRFETLADADGRLRAVADMGRFGNIRVAFNGTQGWVDHPYSGFIDADSAVFEQIELQHPWTMLRDWREGFPDITVLRREAGAEGDHFIVRLKSAKGFVRTVHVDAATWLPAKLIATPSSKAGPALEITYTIGDYRNVNGVMLPFRVEVSDPITGSMVLQVEEVAANVEATPSDFEIHREG